MPNPPARLPTTREGMMRRRSEMQAVMAELKNRFVEPILGRFPRILPTKPDSAARYALYAAVVWFFVWILLAATLAIKLVFPEFLHQFAWAGYGRLRQVEMNVLLWGVLFTGGMGAAFAIIPRVVGRQLWSERIGAQLVLLHVQLVLAGTVLLSLGRTQGIDGLEWPWPIDFGLMAVMLGALQVLMTTIMRRPDKPLNPPAKFLIAAFHVLPITYAVANFSAPFTIGVKQTFYSGFGSAGLMLGLSLIGMGATLFALPRATGNPLWSGQVADWTLYLMLFTLPWLGLAQRVLGPAPDWTETLGIAMALAALTPAVFALALVIGTARGGRSDDPAVPFFIGATVLWSAGIAQLAIGALRHPAGILGTTWWNEGTRTALQGAFGLWLIGLVYHLIPRVRGRALRNPALVRAHFWLSVSGVGVAWIAASAAGLIQGYVQSVSAQASGTFVTGEGWNRVYGAVRPMLGIRMAAGGLIVAGVLLFLLNVQRSLAEGHDVEPDVVAPALVGSRG